MKKAFLLVILVLIPTLLSAKDDRVILQLKWYHQFQFAGYYIALEKGYYRDLGIEAEIREGGPSINVEESLLSGEAQFGVLGSEILLMHSEGRDFMVLAPIMQHSIRAIITGTDRGINSIHDLAGKRIMLNTNELAEFQAMFAKEGIDMSRLNIISKTGEADKLLLEGEIDGINGSIANQPFFFSENGLNTTLIRPITYGIDFYGDTLFTTGQMIRENEELAENFKEASIKGWEYAFNNPEETIDIIRQKYNPDKSHRQLYFEYEQLKRLISPELVEIGHNNMDRWKHIGDTYVGLNLIDKNYSLDNFFFDRENRQSMILKRLMYTLAAVLSLFFLIFIIIIYLNRKLEIVVKVKVAEIKSIIESMPSLLAGLDKELKINLWNRSAREQTGMEENRVLGKDLFEILPYLEGEREIITESIIEGKNYRDLKHKYGEGNRVQYRDIAVYPIQAGRKRGAVLRVDNITEQVRMTEIVIQTEKMMSVGGLAAGMAHEINNPLAGILQSAEVMAHRLYKRIDSDKSNNAAEEVDVDLHKFKKYLETKGFPDLINNIHLSVERISKIVNNILGYARKSDSVSKVMIGELINRTLEIASTEFHISSQFDFKNIKINRLIEKGLPPLMVESGKLQQVLFNILKNGSQAMHEAGTADPEMTITVENHHREGEIHISIEDNGPGMTEEIRKRVFEPFFTTKDVGVGTGLGLSLSYFIITENMQGRMSVESSPDRGTKFNIALPVNPAVGPGGSNIPRDPLVPSFMSR